MKIALVGNPNSGKTTMYNSLTGSNQYVGNWPGVTVEKKEGKVKGYKDIILTDLPGIYSLSPYSLEEVITRDYLLANEVDVIINIIDATNIERNLYLTTQIREINKPMVIALNLIDVVKKRGIKIDIEKMAEILGCPVIVTSALKEEGLTELIERAISLANKPWEGKKFAYSMATVKAIERIKLLINNEDQYLAVKLLDRDDIITKNWHLKFNDKINDIIRQYEQDIGSDSQTALVEERYKIIETIVIKSLSKEVYKLTNTEKIDKIVTNRILALPIFIAIMFIIYYISIISIGNLTTSGMEYLFHHIIANNLKIWLQNINVASWLISLIIDGIIGGVGAILVFLPQLMILFFFLSLLEDSGYMARVAFIMDSIFRRFGLSGKSFIPMLIGTGCSVPAIMASRTIENEKDRRMTIILTPFIPCGAKLPVFALFIGAFFGPFAAVSMYLLGIIIVIVCGIILKRTKYFRGQNSPFIMELPEYRWPSLKNLLLHIWERGKAFLIKAGTIIFAASSIIWFLQSFSWRFQLVSPDKSILASIGKLIAPLFIPLGFGNWQASVSTLTGIVAKENIVATFSILLGNDDNTLISNLRTLFTPVSGYAYMAFILLAAPCLASISATRKEMGSWKLTLSTVLFQTFVAYIVALMINQVGGFLFDHRSFLSTIIIGSLLFLLFILAIIKTIKHKGCGDSCGGCDKNCSSKKHHSR